MMPKMESLRGEPGGHGVDVGKNLGAFAAEEKASIDTRIGTMGFKGGEQSGFKGSGMSIERQNPGSASENAGAQELGVDIGAYKNRCNLMEQKSHALNANRESVPGGGVRRLGD